MRAGASFDTLDALAQHLRTQDRKYTLLFAYNGTGKTRLSMAFKDLGKRGESRDTLYFNAFTEDLFAWDNDLEGDSNRFLRLNHNSRFLAGLDEFDMETKVGQLLHRYADFDFRIDTDEWIVRFSRTSGESVCENIKISRGEENIFIWCFFLAVVQLAMDPDVEVYSWVKYVYIDDPISSLDEHNAIVVACHLNQIMKNQSRLKFILSTHHILFFNVLCNEIGKGRDIQFYLRYDKPSRMYVLHNSSDTPSFYHIAMLAELKHVVQTGKIYNYHFNILRSVLEKTANFHGYNHFSECLRTENADYHLHKRMVDLLNHGNYSLYDPKELLEDSKNQFKKILEIFLRTFPFHIPDRFTVSSTSAS